MREDLQQILYKSSGRPLDKLDADSNSDQSFLEVENLSSQIATLKINLAEVAQELNGLKSFKAKPVYTDSGNSLVEKTKQLVEMFKNLSAENEALSTENSKLNAENEELNKTHTNLKETYEELEKVHSKLETVNEEVVEFGRQASSTIRKLRIDLVQEKNKNLRRSLLLKGTPARLVPDQTEDDE